MFLIRGLLLHSQCSIHTCFHQVTKHKVDDMGERSRPPRCRLALKWTGETRQQFPTTSHRVDLEGAKRPYHYFTILLPETGWVLWLAISDTWNYDIFTSKTVCCKRIGQSAAFHESFTYNAKQSYLSLLHSAYCDGSDIIGEWNT